MLEVAKGTWPLQVLRLPLGAGEVVCEVEESELLVRLHELGTNGRHGAAGDARPDTWQNRGR